MTPERWDRIERLASAVLELPPDQRSAYLERETQGDAGLRGEVESLIEAGDLQPDFMVASLVRRVPEYVGHYRVVQSLGEGGMGEVLLATRDDGTFQRRVAIKLLRRDLVTDGFLRRFHAERRILARLNHPGIAPLFDGGQLDDGRPYFVMEYVEGEPLTHYCDRKRLSIRDRLRLFEHLCETVHYAHQNLVIHRDLKPGNVLVKADGVVRLLDFGIAKLLDEHPEDCDAPITRTGAQLMTPEYAAPEQIRGEPATTSTDVYALGVILYELVSGIRPFAREGRSRHEVERAICDEEPESPSRAVSRESESEISFARSTRPERLHRILRGDLENVVQTAMRKEPERRYASAEQLAEDVRRYLDGRPVMARKDTWSYRTSRFVRRHRAAVFVSAIAVSALVVSGIMAISQRNRAEVEARRSEEVADFLQGIFESATPNVSGGEDVTARELLEQGAARIDHELVDRPGVQVRMLRIIASAFESLGNYDRARPLAERSVALARDLYGTDHPETALALIQLASVARFLGQNDEAERLLRDVIAIQEDLPGDHRLDLAQTRDRLGWLLREMGRYDEAEALLRKAVDAFHSDPDARPGDLAISMHNLGTTLFQRGDLDAAEPIQRQSLAMLQASFGVENTEVATALLNLGKTLHDRGELAEAERLLRESLALWRKLVGEDHRSIAIVQTRLGWLLHDAGRLDEAKEVMDSVLALRRRLHDGPHIGIASALSGVAMIHLARNDPKAAEPFYRSALDIYLQLLGPDHPYTATSRYNLGRALRLEGALDEAEDLLRQALTTRSQTLDPNHPQLAQSHLELGRLLLERGLARQAESKLSRALEINQRVFGDSARQVRDVRAELSRLHADARTLSAAQ